MKNLHAFDFVVAGYFASISLIVIAVRPPGAWAFLAFHALVVILIALLAWAGERFGGVFWTFCRYWYVVPVVMASFRELHYLIPRVHPFDDGRWDRALAEIDRRWLGDVDGFFLSMSHPLLVDALHLCYWFYFGSMIIVGAVLYARSEWPKLREYLSVVMLGLYLSYLGYFAVPAVGPHHFFPARPPALDGWGLGAPLHRTLLWLELRMPDAFPSGHALMSMIVIILSWRFHRRTFAWVVAPAAGCILATVALRYHYVVDVAASVAILPGVVWAGTAFHRAREGKGDGARTRE
jgi:hypothetical protein